MKAKYCLLATVLCLVGFGVYQRYKRPTTELPLIKQFPEVPDQQTHESFEVAELLVSHNPEQRDHGEELWRENRTRIMDDISQRLQSRHPVILCSAAYDLKLLISPWMRGREQSRRHAGMMAIHQLTRPVDRVASIPEAPMLRKILQKELEWMAKISADSAREGVPFVRVRAFQQFVQVLGELADDKTIDWTIDFLNRIRTVEEGEAIFTMIDSCFGVPASFRRGPLLCGLSSDAERAALAASKSHKMEMAKIDAREIWSELRTMSQEDRITYAVGEWRKLILPNMRASSDYYLQYGWLDEHWEPLIRFGSSALPALRAQQKQAPEFDAKAIWACIIAAIEGSADGEFVKELFEKDPAIACKIIAITGSKQWAPELERLATFSHYGKASEAMASCFYDECRPILERILKTEGTGTTTDYLLREFELRSKTNRLPRVY